MEVGLAEDRRDEEDRRIEETIQREQSRLRNFIRIRVHDDEEVEDILQDAFYELVEAYRMMRPIEQAGAWLFRVVRNRIIDRFRKKRPVPFSEGVRAAKDDLAQVGWEELLPSPDAGPEALYAPASSSKSWTRRSMNSPRNNERCLWRMKWRAAASRRFRPRVA